MDPTGFEASGTMAIAVWSVDDRWVARIGTTTRPDAPLGLDREPRAMTIDDICRAVREWLTVLRTRDEGG